MQLYVAYFKMYKDFIHEDILWIVSNHTRAAVNFRGILYFSTLQENKHLFQKGFQPILFSNISKYNLKILIIDRNSRKQMTEWSNASRYYIEPVIIPNVTSRISVELDNK